METFFYIIKSAIAVQTIADKASSDVYLVKTGVEGAFGLARTRYTANTLTLYRSLDDVDWNYVRVRI